MTAPMGPVVFEKEFDLDGPSHLTVPRDDSGETAQDRFVYVDEDDCVGCGWCPSVARNTFIMSDDVDGKARVIAQGADLEEVVEEARDCCPSNSIYYVPYEDLQRLEEQRIERGEGRGSSSYASYQKHIPPPRSYDGESKKSKDQREYRARKAARLWKDRASGKVKADRAEAREKKALDAILTCDVEDVACTTGLAEPDAELEGFPESPGLAQTLTQFLADECDLDAPDDCAPPAGFDDVIITQDCNEECEASRMEAVEGMMHDECDLDALRDLDLDECAAPVSATLDLPQDCDEECDASRQQVIKQMLMQDTREVSLLV
jgi:ferredoxin